MKKKMHPVLHISCQGSIVEYIYVFCAVVITVCQDSSYFLIKYITVPTYSACIASAVLFDIEPLAISIHKKLFKVIQITF